MSKVAYLIITDLHLSGSNLRGRYDYLKEVSYVISKIIELGNKYRAEGYTEVNLIFLGDIVDRSYKDLTKGIYTNNIFVAFLNIFNNMFSVVGNHELSYYTDNPFWTLMESISSNKIETIKNKTWQPQGFIQLINVVDRLECGDVVFHFNHSNVGISVPEKDKINIGLFHQDIIAKAITEEMKNQFGMDIFEVQPRYFDKTSVLYGYDYAFFGHMHKVYGHWTYICDSTKYKTELFYLASLGRTNHTEVSNNFLERDIPAVILENDKFARIEHNKFNLMTREECVKEEIVLNNQMVREKKKEIKYVIENVPALDEPIKSIESALVKEPVLHMLFSDYRKDGYSKIESALLNRVEDILNEYR